jgi:hypothetical protein
VAQFEDEYPSLDTYWRSIILFGRNSASPRMSSKGMESALLRSSLATIAPVH